MQPVLMPHQRYLEDWTTSWLLLLGRLKPRRDVRRRRTPQVRTVARQSSWITSARSSSRRPATSSRRRARSNVDRVRRARIFRACGAPYESTAAHPHGRRLAAVAASSARTSRICCWRARSRAAARSACDSRSARAAVVSFGSCSRRASCSRWLARPPDCSSQPGEAASSSRSRPDGGSIPLDLRSRSARARLHARSCRWSPSRSLGWRRRCARRESTSRRRCARKPAP